MSPIHGNEFRQTKVANGKRGVNIPGPNFIALLTVSKGSREFLFGRAIHHVTRHSSLTQLAQKRRMAKVQNSAVSSAMKLGPDHKSLQGQRQNNKITLFPKQHLSLCRMDSYYLAYVFIVFCFRNPQLIYEFIPCVDSVLCA